MAVTYHCKFRRSSSMCVLVIYRISLEYAQQLLEETTDVESEHDVDQGKLIPYLLKETSLSEAHVLTIVSECFFAGVDTVSDTLRTFVCQCISCGKRIVLRNFGLPFYYLFRSFFLFLSLF